MGIVVSFAVLERNRPMTESLSTLRRLQEAFDRVKGFENLPFSPHQRLGHRSNALLNQIEFVVLALAGEVGELCDRTKRTRRQLALRGPRTSFQIPDLSTDVGDILAYLLKFSNIAGIDPAIAYLEVMSRNCLRFRNEGSSASRLKIVSLLGPPGSGKTAIVRTLGMAQKRHDYGVYIERPERNPFFLDSRHDKGRVNWGESQQWFLRQHFRAIARHHRKRAVVLDQDPSATVLVYAKDFASRGLIDQLTYKRLLEALLAAEIASARQYGSRTIIKLSVAPEHLWERVKKRGATPLETKQWVGALHKRFEETYGEATSSQPLFTHEIDTTHMGVNDCAARVADIIAERKRS
jgi:deoxyadenosine/deoxycytidine kinase/NTP pyrophosphatase (non-canonical NTP hydrolase)